MITATRLRRWHAYIGLLIAPSVLFFALTGAVQIFDLHEAHGSYRPAVLLEKLSALHKDQVFERPHHHEVPAAAPASSAGGSAHPADDEGHPAGGAAQQADEDEPGASTLALKWFCLLVAVGLALSTVIGVWMGISQLRRPVLAWTLIAAGVAVPLFMLAI